LDASLSRPDTVTARGVAKKPGDASVNLPADLKPRVQRRVDSLLWEVYRDALVTVVLWLVLLAFVLFALSMATDRARPAVPVSRLACFSPDVSETTNAYGGDDSQTCSPTTPQDPKAGHLDRPKLRRRGTSKACDL
jgi:hypothetical protein